MSYKIYKSGSYIVIEDTVNGTTKELNSLNVQITKTKTDVTLYSVLYDNVAALSNIGLASILDANGDAYTETPWDAFRHEACGAVNSGNVIATAAGVTYDNAVSGLTATDVQDAIDEVVANAVILEAQVLAIPGADATTVAVPITSAQILAMGTTPIELLPAPGVGMYYDWSARLEYSDIGANYALVDDVLMIGSASSYAGSNIDAFFIIGNLDKIVIASPTPQENKTTGTLPILYTSELNESLVLTTFNGVNPTDGVGTIRAIITYTVRTFGA